MNLRLGFILNNSHVIFNVPTESMFLFIKVKLESSSQNNQFKMALIAQATLDILYTCTCTAAHRCFMKSSFHINTIPTGKSKQSSAPKS